MSYWSKSLYMVICITTVTQCHNIVHSVTMSSSIVTPIYGITLQTERLSRKNFRVQTAHLIQNTWCNKSDRPYSTLLEIAKQSHSSAGYFHTQDTSQYQNFVGTRLLGREKGAAWVVRHVHTYWDLQVGLAPVISSAVYHCFFFYTSKEILSIPTICTSHK